MDRSWILMRYEQTFRNLFESEQSLREWETGYIVGDRSVTLHFRVLAVRSAVDSITPGKESAL
jgi:hypothetical protein